MVLELIRLEENYDHGTFGVLKISKQFPIDYLYYSILVT
jgi:hypothetical protein